MIPKRRLALIAAFLAAPVLFFWPLWVPIPGVQQTIVAGDFLWEYYPQRVFVGRELWQGRLPVWNPHIFAGQPGALFDPQGALFYPPMWLTALLGGPGGAPWWLVELEAMAHLSLAGLFMSLLVRRLTGARAPAAFAGLAYMFGGYLTGYPLNQLSVLESSIWLPLILWLLDIARERGLRYYVVAGAAWALSFFAGHPQVPLYSLYVAAAFGIATPFPAARGTAHPGPAPAILRSAFKRLGGLALFAVIAVGLAAVQILPTQDLTENSKRTSITAEERARGLGPAEIGALLVPLHWGNQAAYAGMVTLGLALFALVVPPAAGRARRERWLFALIAAGGLALAFGGATPLYWLARALGPGFALIRNQERALAIWSFGVSVLSGYGVAALLGPDGRSRRARIAALVLAGLALAVAFRIPLLLRPDDRPEAQAYYARVVVFALLGAGALLAAVFLPKRAAGETAAAPSGLSKIPAWPALLACVLLADLYTANGRYALSESGDPAPMLQAVRFIKADPAVPFRVSSENLLPGAGDAGMIYDFEDVVGNSSFEPAAYDELWTRVRTDTSEGTILALLNVKYILTERLLPPIDGQLTLAHQEDTWNLYRIEHPLPRAYVVHSATIAPDVDAAAARLRAPDFDPRREVVLAGDAAGTAGSARDMTPVTLRIPGPTRWTIVAEPVADGWLVLSQRGYPGWQAYVDGRPVEALRADIALSAIPLTAGRHTVEWVFEPQALRLGGAITLVTLAAALVLIILAGRRRRG